LEHKSKSSIGKRQREFDDDDIDLVQKFQAVMEENCIQFRIKSSGGWDTFSDPIIFVAVI